MSAVPTIIPVRQRQPRVQDRKYLDYLREQPCIVTGRRDVEPAHLRLLGSGGTSMKPNDALCLPLYWALHRQQDNEAEIKTWLRWVNEDEDFLARLLIEVAENRYAKWYAESLSTKET